MYFVARKKETIEHNPMAILRDEQDQCCGCQVSLIEFVNAANGVIQDVLIQQEVVSHI
jgi:hypothetical protein